MAAPSGSITIQGQDMYYTYMNSRLGPFNISDLLQLASEDAAAATPAGRRLLNDGSRGSTNIRIAGASYDGSTLWIVMSIG